MTVINLGLDECNVKLFDIYNFDIECCFGTVEVNVYYIVACRVKRCVFEFELSEFFYLGCTVCIVNFDRKTFGLEAVLENVDSVKCRFGGLGVYFDIFNTNYFYVIGEFVSTVFECNLCFFSGFVEVEDSGSFVNVFCCAVSCDAD